MSLSEVSLSCRYTGTGLNELVSGTTFAEVFNVSDPSGILTETAYNAWCLDAMTRIGSTRVFDYKTYSGDELADGLDPNAIISHNGKLWDNGDRNLDLINWLLNQNYQGSNATVTLGGSLSGVVTMGDIQGAIWQLLGQQPYLTSLDLNALGSYDQRRIDALAAAARANGEGFEADHTQVQGIVIVDNITILESRGIKAGTIAQPLFLMTKAAQLGDYVWLDVDKDGIQDETELGLGGITVKLLRDMNGDGTIAVNEVVATTSTDTTGYYDFKGLVGGVEYQVLFDIQNSSVVYEGETFNGASFFLTQANIGNDLLDSDATQVLDPNTFATTYLSQTVTLTAGEFNQSIDAGFWAEGVGTPPTADLGDYVWNDANRNGIQDSGEAGISGATVNIIQDGTVIATTTTDSTGYYEFLGLAAGVEYQVSFDISGLAGSRSFALTAANRGTNDALDSDATIVNGVAITSGIILEGGEFNQTIDAGFYDSSAGLSAPGTGTPGFWSSKQGAEFWDGIIGNEAKAGTSGFAKGELLTPGATGILVGDFNRNGVTDNGENTIFFNFNDAITLVDSKNHKDTTFLGGEKGALMLGRATVAGWLNYLAGNSVDLASGAKDIANYLDNAVSWLDAYQSGSINSTNLANDPLSLGASGNQLATILDEYNNGSAQFATGNFHRS